MPNHGPLTMSDLYALRVIAAVAQDTRRVRWANGDDVLEGVARSIGDERGNFLHGDQDVRDGFLRISGTFEYFLPVTQVMALVRTGEFVAASQ